MSMFLNAGAWVGARTIATTDQLRTAVLADPTPAPSGGGFDWNKIHPDPSSVPKSDTFYNLINGLMFVCLAASALAFLGGLIGFTVGPIFGAHIMSDRGKSMLWKALLGAVLLGSFSSIMLWAMAR